MKLQIAMDMTTIEEYWRILEEVHEYIDIIEIGNIGTYEGTRLIPMTKEKYPDKEVVWDQKAHLLYFNIPAIDMGADYVSMDVYASDKEYELTVEYAHAKGCKVIGDMETCDMGSASMIRLERLNVDQVSFFPNAHIENYPAGDTEQLEIAQKVLKRCEMCAYGGLTVDNIKPVLALKPDIVAVGAGLFKADNPKLAAKTIKEMMNEVTK